MKCPKCKKEMHAHAPDSFLDMSKTNFHTCKNVECWFYGIKRIEVKQ